MENSIRSEITVRTHLLFFSVPRQLVKVGSRKKGQESSVALVMSVQFLVFCNHDFSYGFYFSIIFSIIVSCKKLISVMTPVVVIIDGWQKLQFLNMMLDPRFLANPSQNFSSYLVS